MLSKEALKRYVTALDEFNNGICHGGIPGGAQEDIEVGELKNIRLKINNETDILTSEPYICCRSLSKEVWSQDWGHQR